MSPLARGLAVGPIVNDGVVALYPAHSDALGCQSSNSVKGPTLGVSHYDLREALALERTIKGWIAGF